jgi:hypothetical protein
MTENESTPTPSTPPILPPGGFAVRYYGVDNQGRPMFTDGNFDIRFVLDEEQWPPALRVFVAQSDVYPDRQGALWYRRNDAPVSLVHAGSWLLFDDEGLHSMTDERYRARSATMTPDEAIEKLRAANLLTRPSADSGPVYCGNGPDFLVGGLIPRGITAEEFDAAVESVRTREGTKPEIWSARWDLTSTFAQELRAIRNKLFGPNPEPAPTEPGIYLAKDGATWVLEAAVGGNQAMNDALAEKPWMRLLFPNGRVVPRMVGGFDGHLEPEQAAKHGPFTRLTPEGTDD